VVALLWTSRRDSPAPEAGVPPPGGSALGRFLRQLRVSLRLLHAPGIWLRSLAWSCVSDVVDIAMIGLCLVAVGIHAPVGAWCLVLLAVNLAVVVPSTPGQFGVLEAAAVLVLGALGAGVNEALAFALLYHAAHALPVAALGLLSLRRTRV